MTAAVALWRIATETRKYKAVDLSGTGAAISPGRWNHANEPAVYCAQTLSLAVLETAAHLDDHGLPLDRFVVRIDVPGDVWQAREALAADELDPAWQSIPAGQTSADIGSAWLSSRRSPLLLVPSVIVPEESAVLLNPAHPKAAKLTASVRRPFDYDRLFRHP